ncbi:carotenoid 1,2-hydratase [Rhodoplanes elegans]|uniref:Carotenoid 1,2-hydratase n=1 Tax=Rhodoplanes elegans TaxID=29408 RepID=A0A327KMZ3_9BRAD|nr:carotenoid 1,2-hydratase [Rhodoplanes elegans]MBK5957543.1 carotenoid 1,2-hydratase [Rhodoplanes elegans]RAI39346.1 carotenoid 1,2-hydratase [Rhodoplanes elegans]
MSEDGRHGLTIIAFVGSVFSPYYAWARRRAPGGAADPHDHCAINVALYGEPRRWAMTERGRGKLFRDRTNLKIGPSALAWDGETLVITIDETTVPVPSRLAGTVRVRPAALTGASFALDDAGLHQWRPIAPCSDVEVEFSRPALAWRGHGYLDSNRGETPLETAFVRWDWSRAALADGAAVLYHAIRRGAAGPAGRDHDGVDERALALRFDRAGTVTPVEVPHRVMLPDTLWRMPRETRSDRPDGMRVAATFEDSPFYTRSLLTGSLLGEEVSAVHESLSLDRFAAPWVQAMLPFRMPRLR